MKNKHKEQKKDKNKQKTVPERRQLRQKKRENVVGKSLRIYKKERKKKRREKRKSLLKYH